MALPLQPTLSEIRAATLTRCGIASSGNIPRNISDIIDEKIRSAQIQIYELYPWLANYVSRTTDLIADTKDYDVPDDTDPGHIDFISVRRISDGKLYPLEPGIRPGETNLFVNSSASLPTRYAFIDQMIHIEPVPDVTLYDVLVLQYFQVPGQFVEDTERAVVDGEALKTFAEILVKEHFGGQDTDKLRADLGRYLERKRTRQSDGGGFQMGGRLPSTMFQAKRNRFADQGGGTSWQDWRPW